MSALQLCRCPRRAYPTRLNLKGQHQPFITISLRDTLKDRPTMAGAFPQEIDLAFSGNDDLRKRVHAAISTQNYSLDLPLFRSLSLTSLL
jgi:hypothetical protein